jgi:hypothetical protein
MVIYGVDEEAAFDELREASNQSNIAVRDIAYSLVQLFSGPDVTELPTREAIAEFLAAPIRPDDL